LGIACRGVQSGWCCWRIATSTSSCAGASAATSGQGKSHADYEGRHEVPYFGYYLIFVSDHIPDSYMHGISSAEVKAGAMG
jgi:hypothetical protein